jgi:hypothetical protein
MWENRNSYINLIEEFGLPTAVNPEKGGGAIWNSENHKINLFDQKFGVEPEPTIHVTTPIKLFAGVNPETVKISDRGVQQRISDIISILPKYISYNPVQSTITTRFYNLPISYYLTTLCMKITTGELNTSEARTLLADTLSNNKNSYYKTSSERYIKEYLDFATC